MNMSIIIRKLISLTGFFLLTTFLVTALSGQKMNKLVVTESTSLNIDMNSVIAAGENSEKVVSNNQWLNYSLHVNPSDPVSSISVSVVSGTLPPGVEIYVQAGRHTGNGQGKTGVPAGKVKIDNVPKVILGGIGSSSTGNGNFQGHQIIFSIMITDFALLRPGNYTIYLQYTLN